MGAARFLMRPPPLPDGIEITDLAIDGSDGRSIAVRCYTPTRVDGPLPVLLWIHGGGMILGDHRDDQWGAFYADALGIAVASTAYRLAPEHPFPAALDDVTAAARWALAGGEGRFVPSRCVIGGESAGGGLAAAVVQRLTDQGIGVSAQLLVYPMLDDRTAVRSDIEAKEHAVWNKAANHLGWSSYLDGEPGSPTVPLYAVPGRRDDLAGLPPTWIGVGTVDLFHDECIDYSERLRTAGVDCELDVVEGAPHGFASIAPKASITRSFRASSGAFVRRMLLDQSQRES